MRWIQIAVMLMVTVGMLETAARGQNIGRAPGVVGNRINGGIEEHNQAVEDAINGTQQQRPQAQLPAVSPDGLKSGWLTRKSSGKDVRLYFAYPAALTKAKPAAGLIVLQEWWGVNDDIQGRVQEFAAKGFYAVAPDLFNGKVTEDPAEAAKLKDAMTDAAAMAAMKAGLDLLGEEERNGVVDAKRVGVVGWCMGGQQALLLSLADPRVKATAIFYGPLVTDPVRLRGLQGPVLGIFGNNDTAPSPADVQKFQEGLKAAGKNDVTIMQVDGVGHAFASKAAAKVGLYNEEKAGPAWAKLWEWLDAKLPRK